jgi:hypothetical protein
MKASLEASSGDAALRFAAAHHERGRVARYLFRAAEPIYFLPDLVISSLIAVVGKRASGRAEASLSSVAGQN